MAMLRESMLLELRGVTIAFADRTGQATVLADRVDLGLRAGRMHCVTGLEGTGKSSILRVAAGLLQPSAGSVSWGGEELGALGDAAVSQRRGGQLGYADQAATLIDQLSVLENVLVPAVPRRSATALAPRAQQILEELGIAELARLRPGQLTVAERRRVALARALVLEPPLLIVDEPTAGLDRDTGARVGAALLRLRENGVGLLLASRDQALIDAADNRTTLG